VIAAGDRVRPAANGVHRDWTALRGTVVDVWQDGKEARVQVRWDNDDGTAYGTTMPEYLLVVLP
jgi:hypothetical protein